jgi:hypothetical protein
MSFQPGDFSFMRNSMSRNAVADIYQAVEAAEAWDLMKEEPETGKGYMFSSDPRYKLIHEKMRLYEDHSGASYGWTMRQAQFIAQKGWTEYVKLYLSMNA